MLRGHRIQTFGDSNVSLKESSYGHTTVRSDAIRWEVDKDGKVPQEALIAGRSQSNENLYIGRAPLRENWNQLVPGTVIPSEKCLLVSFGTGVKRLPDYEVLVVTNSEAVHWVSCKGGKVPCNAVIGGTDCSLLEPYFIGRTKGSLEMGKTWRGHRLKTEPIVDHNVNINFPGKIQWSHKCLYIPHEDKEYLFRNYEVLVMAQTPISLEVLCKHSICKHFLSLFRQKTQPQNDEQNESNFIKESLDSLPLPNRLKEFCKLSYTT